MVRRGQADQSEDMSENATRQQILIVDDEEVNRTILSLMFDAEYDIVEAGLPKKGRN